MMTGFGNIHTWGESQGGGLAVERAVAAVERACRHWALRDCRTGELTFAAQGTAIAQRHVYFGAVIEPFMVDAPFGYACNAEGRWRDVVRQYLCAVSPAFGCVECVTLAAAPLLTTVFVNGQERCTITEYVKVKKSKGIWQRLRDLLVGSYTFVVRQEGLVCAVWSCDFCVNGNTATIDVVATDGHSVAVPLSSRAAEKMIRNVACPEQFDLLAHAGACTIMGQMSVLGINLWFRLARYQFDFSDG